MVSLYAFGHLVNYVRQGTILSELTQIGIEVAVRQLPPDKEHPRKKKDVRKDLVIWPDPGMTLWKANIPHNEPLAVMEWKVNHYLSRASHQQNRREHQEDIRWLRATSLRLGMTDFVGYAVLVENTQVPKRLICTRVHAGVDEQFLTLAEKTATHDGAQLPPGLP